MRPIKLEMTAFCSYADKTEVPFYKFNNGLFLITGITGAGKTTIFDAIVFALYGVASGDDRKPGMLHCDRVSKSVDTVVKLEFEQSGRHYKVERTIHFPVKRGAKNEYGDIQYTAILEEPDGRQTEKPTNVTERITEILGLNSNQFQQIVMLAQGEFKKFLEANSEKKSEILGKLFDNSQYIRYQTLFYEASKKMNEKRKASLDRITTAMADVFQTPEDLEGFSEEDWLPQNPQLLEKLNEAINLEEDSREKTAMARNEKLVLVNKLNTEKGTAEAHNQLLDELDQKKEHLEELEGNKEAISQLREKHVMAEKAFHKVVPENRINENNRNQLKGIRENIAVLTGEKKLNEEALNSARKAVEEDKPKAREVKSIIEQTVRLGESLKQIKALNDLEDKISNRITELDGHRKQREANAEELNRMIEQKQSYDKESEDLKDCDAQIVKLTGELEALNGKITNLNGENGVSEIINDVDEVQKNLNTEKAELENLILEAQKAGNEYVTLYNRFLSGQASVLNRDLQKKIQEEGQAVCPVCGTVHSRGDTLTHIFDVEEVPSQDEVEQARTAHGDAEERRQQKDKRISSLSDEIENKKANAVRIMQSIFDDCPDWQALTKPGYLKSKTDYLNSESLRLKEGKKKAEQGSERLKEVTRLNGELAAEREKLLSEDKTLEGKVKAETQELERWQKESGELKASLTYKDEEEVNRQITDLNTKKTALEEAIDVNQKQLEETEKACAKTNGSLDTEQKKLPQAEKNYEESSEKLRRVLSECGFDSVETANQVLTGIENPDSWIRETDKRISDFDHDLSATQNRVKELAEQTKSFVRQNLDALIETIDKETENYNLLNTRLNSEDTMLNNHKAVRETVSQERAKIAESDHAAGLLEKLSDLAVGTNSEGGRLSFSRYVMGTAFKEVIERANMRLEIMSGGQYQLVHMVGASKQNQIAGLEIEVLDRSTGKQRASGSLSGGEKFITSLALALGLSDTVQSHSGGQALDALFIDEGFGSLDDDVLDKALTVLSSLSDDNSHLVGIISHISRLDESIPQKLIVKNGDKGSYLEVRS